MEKLMEEIWRQGEDRQAKEKSKRELRGMDGSVQVDRSVWKWGPICVCDFMTAVKGCRRG